MLTHARRGRGGSHQRQESKRRPARGSNPSPRPGGVATRSRPPRPGWDDGRHDQRLPLPRQPVPPDLPPDRRDRRVGHPGRRRPGQGPQGGRAAGDRLRRRRAGLPDPGVHRRGGGGGLPRAALPPLHPRRRAARAQGGHRGQDLARLRLRGRSRPGPRHQRRQAGPLQRLRDAARPGRRGPPPRAVLDDVPRVDPARGRCPRGGAHRRVQRLPRPGRGRSRRPARRARRSSSSSHRPTRPARCTRPSRWRRSAAGPSSTACGSSPTRSTSTSSTATRRSARCRRSCPSSPSGAWSSTASPRRTR